jgi:flagellar biosynthetic protein FlhB
VGFLFTTKALSPKFSRINPISGLARMFSFRSIIDLIKALIKAAIIAYVIYSELKGKTAEIPQLMTFEVQSSFMFMINTSMNLALKVGMYLLIIGIADYFYQWWEFEKNLRMSKQEVKEEFKLLEGDPVIKGQIKRKQREIGMRRMMQAVNQSDVVITNPTHFAIALKYDAKAYKAPVVVAKGKDFVAQKIKEKAKECKIEIVENKPLARALYATTDVGKQIPESLYKAVAEILAQIYKIKKERINKFEN